MQNQRAYTLLEMLLVIAVIAVIAAMSLMMLHDRSKTLRINKAALEVQQVLAGAMNYYNDRGQWPLSNMATYPQCDMPTADNDFKQYYLPNGLAKSSFGFNYCWMPIGNPDSSNKPLFLVALQVPNQDQHIAERIAARLPSAIVTASPGAVIACDGQQPCFVQAEIGRPGGGQQSDELLMAIGHCNKANTDPGCRFIGNDNKGQTFYYQLTFRHCPAGFQPKVLTSPNYYSQTEEKQTARSLGHLSADNEQTRCAANAAGTQQICNLQATAFVCGGRCKMTAKNVTDIGLSYIAICEKHAATTASYRY